MSPHIALLGDSVFDNDRYTGGGPNVIEHLVAMLPAAWQASLCAVDGSTTANVTQQISRVPSDATHVVLSVGGNDALSHISSLSDPAHSTAEALIQLGMRVGRFESSYRRALAAILALGHETTVCTVYEADLQSDLAFQASVALKLFNDIILRVAFEHCLAVIDLRLVCTQSADFAFEIEPSALGGKKIAAAIYRSLVPRDDATPHSRVYGI